MIEAPSARVVFKATFAVVAAILLAICAAYAAFTYQRWRAAEDVQATVGVSRDLFDAMQNVRLQRGVIAAAIEAPAALTSAEQGELTASRAEISLDLTSALARLERGGAPDSAQLAARLRAGRARFMAAQKIAESQVGRGEVEGEAASKAWIAADDRFVATMVGISSEMSDLVHRQDGLLGRMVSISRLAWSTRSAAGDTWIILHRALVRARPLAPQESVTLAELVGREEGAWDMVEGLGHLSDTPQPLKAAIAKADQLHFVTARARMMALEADLQAGRPSAASGRAWLADGGTSLASLTQVGIVAFDQASLSAQADAQAAERQFFLALGVMLLVAGCGWASSFFMIRRYVGPMGQVTDAMRALAAGDLDARIPCLDRRDEIGQLVQALGVFREN
ncbi:MAG TPA: HAMP domain-containing protein, partial [Caulobacteraceae bacterium]|nr:HAMP domain-containing protein [Caulobacteraceae bacterium]